MQPLVESIAGIWRLLGYKLHQQERQVEIAGYLWLHNIGSAPGTSHRKLHLYPHDLPIDTRRTRCALLDCHQ